MSLKAYEDACTRAELFGEPLPDKEEFLAKNKHLDVVEFEEVEIKAAENTAMLNDTIKEGSSGLAELNIILNSTQTKINRLKGVCGTITNFFRVKISSKDNLSYSSEPSYVGQTNDKDYIAPTEIGSINQGLGPNDNEMTPRAKQNGRNSKDDLDAMKIMDKPGQMRKVITSDISKQVNKLENMINQAERAESSLHHQNKQMRSFLR